LEKGRELGRGRRLLMFRGALPPTFMNNKVVRGGSAWGVIPEGWGEPARCRVRGRHDFAHPRSLKDEARAGVLVLQISGQRHHPFLPVVEGAGSVVLGAEVTKGGGVVGVEVPTPATTVI